MPKFARMVRSSLPFAGLIFLCLLTVSQKSSAVNVSTTTYFFRGTCTDCTGTGDGALILQNYTLGTPITPTNFITFSYQSNLTGFTISSGSLQSISGTLPTSLPAHANIIIT